MQSEILAFIKKNNLFEKSDKLLLAVSGGKDSMYMLHNLWSQGYNVSVAHVNFGLRAQESDGDELFLREFCKNKCTFFTKKVDTKAFAKLNKLSTQMAARTLRYDWFQELAAEHQFKFILTAHHLADNIETQIIGLIKGINIHNIGGMPQINDNVIRPMLGVKKEHIDQYMKRCGLAWREDSSNMSDDYTRNKIRHQVTPIIAEINPGYEHTFETNFEKINAWKQLIFEQINQVKNQCTTNTNDDFIIPKSVLRNSTSDLIVLDELLKPFEFNFDQIKSILDKPKTGSKFISKNHVLYSNRNDFTVVSKNQINIDVKISSIGTYDLGRLKLNISTQDYFPSKEDLINSNILFVENNIDVFQLQIRNWKLGDKIKPLGMKGSKLISDVLIDKKIDKSQKHNQLVLTNNEDVIWLLHLKTSEKYKIDKTMIQFLKLEITEKNH